MKRFASCVLLGFSVAVTMTVIVSAVVGLTLLTWTLMAYLLGDIAGLLVTSLIMMTIFATLIAWFES